MLSLQMQRSCHVGGCLYFQSASSFQLGQLGRLAIRCFIHSAVLQQTMLHVRTDDGANQHMRIQFVISLEENWPLFCSCISRPQPLAALECRHQLRRVCTFHHQSTAASLPRAPGSVVASQTRSARVYGTGSWLGLGAKQQKPLPTNARKLDGGVLGGTQRAPVCAASHWQDQ